jgi:mannitol/fructose-specific phosphotransferase system IIA component (Ntr-type)
LTLQRIRVPLAAADKAAAIRELAAAATEGKGTVVDEVVQAIEERERMYSTGLGYGVAMPHARSGELTDVRLAAGVSAVPIDFGAIDGEPVRLFFLLVGPEREAGTHVKALSRLARMVRRLDVRTRLVGARSGEEFFRHLRDAECV